MDLGSTLKTDGWQGQLDVALFGYTPRILVVFTPQRAHQVAPHINRVFRNLKTWLNGMHRDVEMKNLQSYMDEFVFRFNRRKTQKEAFQNWLGISIQKAARALPELVNRANCRSIDKLF